MARLVATHLGFTYYAKYVNKWFDGYKGQDVIIVDDVKPIHKKVGYLMLIWADRFGCYG